MKVYLSYQIKSLKRFKIAYYQLVPEYIGLICVVLVFSFMVLGISSDESILINNKKIINYNYLINYFFVIPIILESLIAKDYMPNYDKLKIIFPFSKLKILMIDLFIELLGFKIIILVFTIILYIPFSYIFKLDTMCLELLYVFALVLLSYVNSCFIIRIIKIKSRDNLMNKNFLKIIVLLFLIVSISMSYSIFLLFLLLLLLLIINILLLIKNLYSDDV